MQISLIAAVGKQGQLGLKGELPWTDKQDLQWFKDMTLNKTCIVGYNTLKSLPELRRRNVVLDDVAQTLESIIARLDQDEVFVIGGAKTYRRWMPLVTRFYISQINYNGPADTWMPELIIKPSKTNTTIFY